ncbi:MAG: hypothetical protein R6X06_00400, partial [Gammaproteobacteria bacterium]
MLKPDKLAFVTAPTVIRLMGLAVMCLAALVMFGWLSQIPWLATLFPGVTTKVFSNVLCQFLLGLALILSTLQHPWCRLLQTLIGAVVLLVGGTVIVQYVYVWALPLDLGPLHHWLSGDPGRMAPNTALAYVFAGLTVLLLTHAGPGLRALPALIVAFVMVLLGLTGLLGYRLRPRRSLADMAECENWQDH